MTCIILSFYIHHMGEKNEVCKSHFDLPILYKRRRTETLAPNLISAMLIIKKHPRKNLSKVEAI